MEKAQNKATTVAMQEQLPGSVLEELAREGARQLLAQALEAEVAGFVKKHQDKIGAEGRRQVVRNGHMPTRELVTGIGPLMIRQPRLDDRMLSGTGEERFSSQILPRYLRRVPSVDNLIPILYLKGVSSGDMSEALASILGPDAAGLSATKEKALGAYEHFLSSWREKYPKAVECLQTDVEELFAFYDFPAVHWVHIRTSNPIESTYATVRLRTKKTKGCGSRVATLTMVFKLAREAEKTWRRLMGHEQIPLVMAGKKFIDGELETAA